MRYFVLAVFMASSVSAQPLLVTNSFNNNSVADADAVNRNFADITNGLNTRLNIDTGSPYNTAVGFRALTSNSTGYSNVAVGRQALYNNLNGNQNSAIGAGSLEYNTSGRYNTAVGFHSMQENASGYSNTAIGRQSLRLNTIGSNNMASGFEALFANTEGSDNVAIGFKALYENITGNSNTAVGKSALDQNITGVKNTAIGFDADVGSSDLTNATAIGAEATVSLSNTVQIGNDQLTAVYLGRSGGFNSELANTNLVTAGYLYAQGAILVEQPVITSDASVKVNTKALEMGLGLINDLAPVVYERRGREGLEMGFIAQDVREMMTVNGWSNYSLVHEQDESLSLRYTELLAPMTRAIQELDDASEAKDKQIASLEQKLKSQQKALQSQQEELLAIVQSQQEQIAQLQRMMGEQFASR